MWDILLLQDVSGEFDSEGHQLALCQASWRHAASVIHRRHAGGLSRPGTTQDQFHWMHVVLRLAFATSYVYTYPTCDPPLGLGAKPLNLRASFFRPKCQPPR